MKTRPLPKVACACAGESTITPTGVPFSAISDLNTLIVVYAGISVRSAGLITGPLPYRTLKVPLTSPSIWRPASVTSESRNALPRCHLLETVLAFRMPSPHLKFEHAR